MDVAAVIKAQLNRRVYTAHRRHAPGVPSSNEQEGCATEPYRTPNTFSAKATLQSPGDATALLNTYKKQTNKQTHYTERLPK